MNHLIGLSGRRGSGKDTFLALLNQQLRALGEAPRYAPMALADPLKDMAAVLTGDDPADFRSQGGKAGYLPAFGMSRGELLQKLGTDCLRVGLMDDVWIRSLHARRQGVGRVAVTDVRFPNEADYIRAEGGVLIRLEGNPRGLAGDGTRDDQHPSETSLDDYADFDIVVRNNGSLERLGLAARQVAHSLLVGEFASAATVTIDCAARAMTAGAKPRFLIPGCTLP